MSAEAASRIADEISLAARAEDFAAVQQVVDFWNELCDDPRLREKLEHASDMDSESAAAEVARVAGTAGHRFSDEQLALVTNAILEGLLGRGDGDELSDEDLSHVAGGQGSQQMSQVSQVFQAFHPLGPVGMGGRKQGP